MCGNRAPFHSKHNASNRLLINKEHCPKPFRIKDLRIVFIPLFSCMLDVGSSSLEKIMDPNTRSLLKHNTWVFDRGVIDRGQLKGVEKELTGIANSDDLIVAILHHHLIRSPALLIIRYA